MPCSLCTYFQKDSRTPSLQSILCRAKTPFGQKINWRNSFEILSRFQPVITVAGSDFGRKDFSKNLFLWTNFERWRRFKTKSTRKLSHNIATDTAQNTYHVQNCLQMDDGYNLISGSWQKFIFGFILLLLSILWFLFPRAIPYMKAYKTAVLKIKSTFSDKIDQSTLSVCGFYSFIMFLFMRLIRFLVLLLTRCRTTLVDFIYFFIYTQFC